MRYTVVCTSKKVTIRQVEFITYRDAIDYIRSVSMYLGVPTVDFRVNISPPQGG